MSNYRVKVNGKTFDVALRKKGFTDIEFEIDGEVYHSSIEPTIAMQSAAPVAMIAPSATKPAASNAAVGPGEIRAPMPGVIADVLVAVHQQVEIGETVLVIEAMKMENNITVQENKKVKKIHVTKGDEVNSGQLLITLA